MNPCNTVTKDLKYKEKKEKKKNYSLAEVRLTTTTTKKRYPFHNKKESDETSKKEMEIKRFQINTIQNRT